MRLDTSACRIAVLEDSPTSLAIIRSLLLNHFNCQVACYPSPEELWADSGHTATDLFLLDVTLQDGKTGIDVCRQLQTRDATRGTPVIFFSQHHQPQTRVEALRAGAVDYIDKPFYPAELLQRVDGQLQRFLRQKKLQARTEEQLALLRVLTHDLRNSVGAGSAMLEHFPADADEAEKADWIEMCRKAVRSALDLIEHVAEYHGLLDGNRVLKMETVNAASAVDEACNVVRSAAAAKGISLSVAIPDTLALTTNRVVFIHNIVVNLLTNAVKFSPGGTRITIEGSLTPALRTGPASCRFTIADEGIGIPPAILRSLLKRELVASRPGTAREQGTGIGMTLVQLYVERCRGSIELESYTAENTPPGRKPGTSVHLRFPLDTARPLDSDNNPQAPSFRALRTAGAD